MRLRISSVLFVAVFLSALDVSAAGKESSILPSSADQALARQIFQELININTTHANGSTAAAQLIAKRLLGAGFLPADVTVIAPADKPTKANVVVRYRAKPSKSLALSPVLVLGHLDVVEAKAEDWSFDPFAFREEDGWLYGRGTIDMKDGDAAALASLLRLKREGFTPDRDLIVAFTADEEAGGDANGPAFLLKEHRELIDAGLVLNLDGGGGALKHGERLYFEIGTSEKTYLTYTIEATSPGGHGSLPGPDNAIYRITRALDRLSTYRFPVMLTATTRAAFAASAVFESPALATDLRAVAAENTDLAAAERLSDIVRLNAELRTTCVATLISGGHAENALPQRAKATIQCRMMPNDTTEHVTAQLTKVLDDPKISLSLDAPPIVSPESVLTPRLMARLASVVHSMWPSVPLVPAMATGFSDDRQTRNAGIPSYDVSGIWSEVDENRAHGRDERVNARSFDESVEYTYRLFKLMSQHE
jgi:acetylornithine deacetylase/succinyl-diaminopimelate desuccinylase-like protein